MSTYNRTELAKAIQYLRSRGKYIADVNCTFQPTCAAATDVTKTWEAYRKETASLTSNVRRFIKC